MRTRTGLAAIFLLCASAVDVSRPPERQWSARAAIGAIHVYQRLASPWMRTVGISCRFEPSCSRYAATSIARHGTVRGGWRSLVRLARCGPWTRAGTVDPP